MCVQTNRAESGRATSTTSMVSSSRESLMRLTLQCLTLQSRSASPTTSNTCLLQSLTSRCPYMTAWWHSSHPLFVMRTRTVSVISSTLLWSTSSRLPFKCHSEWTHQLVITLLRSKTSSSCMARSNASLTTSTKLNLLQMTSLPSTPKFHSSGKRILRPLSRNSSMRDPMSETFSSKS